MNDIREFIGKNSDTMSLPELEFMITVLSTRKQQLEVRFIKLILFILFCMFAFINLSFLCLAAVRDFIALDMFGLLRF